MTQTHTAALGRNSGLDRFRPRKLPSQRRSRESVEYIKQATLQLAQERGVRGFTTDDVAERAGVNIASIYQYFPNREAILFSLYEDASAQVLEKMKLLNIDIFDLPIEKAAYRAMDRLLALYEERRFVLLELTADVPELARAVRPVSFENLHRGTMHGFIQHRKIRLTPQQLSRMSFFVWHIGLDCIRNYLLEKPVGVSRRQFIGDLAWIIAAYINKP
jgi:AcrR family transcriptional regulator